VPAHGRAVVAGKLDEVEVVVDRDRAGQVGEEDQARLERPDQQRLALAVVGRDLTPELLDAGPDLPCGQVDLADALVSLGRYEASSRRYRCARRSMSRL
jgi:hypothetical protein